MCSRLCVDEAEIAEFIEEPFFSGSRRGNLLPDFDRFHGPISAVLKSHPGTFLPARRSARA